MRTRATTAAGLGALLALGLAAATAAQTPTTPTTQTPTTPTTPRPTKHAVDLTAKLRIGRQGSAYLGTGPVTGKPFGPGSLTSRSTVQSRSPLRTATTLTARYPAGTVTFKGSGHYAGSTFVATMTVTTATGAYHGATGTGLKVTDVSRRGIDTLRVSGSVTYTDPAPVTPVGY